MKKAILLVASLYIHQLQAQTIIGVNGDIGSSKIINTSLNSISFLSANNAWNLGTNVNFLASKRFNPKISLGYGQKKSTQTYYATFGNNLYAPQNLVTVTSLNQMRLDVGVRFNILNKKHKLFVDLSLANNYILHVNNKRSAYQADPETTYVSNPSSPYYVSLPIGIGYNFNNYFSIAVIYNPGLTAYDNYSQTKVNMWGLNLCYYLPILGNSKAKREVALK